MTLETQITIANWATATFGDGGSVLRVAARANEEMAELLRAATANGPSDVIVEEAADTLIVLARLGCRLAVPLSIRGRSGKAYPHDASLLFAVMLANTNMERTIRALTLGSNAVPWLHQVWAHLKALLERLGTDAQTAIDAKMAVNRTREWRSDGTEHGYHTRVRDPLDVSQR